MNDLILAIEQYKKELAEFVETYGIHSPEAIKCSQELDSLIHLLLTTAEKKELSQSFLG
ncbi:aspartyl-phosphate phosphatase Spo0E family protein [Bacillus sp. MUM 116]|uniref:aspartyl-phosphate phosphatase Spo0E family protein n=1 Tax=Bacillus sp. MUM 116 TaxID=1678002 RepID=UPI0009F3F76D|nr:aspartyl-phosphate phosphatase Spo0E family protein [Bacillus sp. MUM 116]